MNLHDMKMGELRELATRIGLAGQKAESKESLVTRLTLTMHPELLQSLQESGVGKEEAAEPKELERYDIDIEELKEATKNMRNIVLTLLPDNTWHVKNGVAEDSGPLDMPMAVIIRKCKAINEARMPAFLDGREFDPGKPVLA